VIALWPREDFKMAKIKSGECLFCQIIRGEIAAQIIYSDEQCVAFLDHRPLFPGHVLLVPREHVVTLPDLPAELLAPLFANAQKLCRAVQSALQAEGTFVAMNNIVSQSVPHLHVHIVPRKKKDGLKGFFWPRHPYKDEAEMAAVASAIQRALETK
jgi:histidine triad (HIT) family protein